MLFTSATMKRFGLTRTLICPPPHPPCASTGNNPPASTHLNFFFGCLSWCLLSLTPGKSPAAAGGVRVAGLFRGRPCREGEQRTGGRNRAAFFRRLGGRFGR